MRSWAITAETRNYYARIVEFAQSQNAQLIMVNLPYPELTNIVDAGQFLESYREFVPINPEVILYDFETPICEYSCDQYYDARHFNQKEASRFTHGLGESLGWLEK